MLTDTVSSKEEKMSSKAKRVNDKIVSQRVGTVVQVLAIMEDNARKMSFFQRLKLANSFLWKKNIDCFFQLADSNIKEEENGKKDI